MIVHAARIAQDCGPGRARQAAAPAQQLFKQQPLQGGVGFQRIVQVVYIGLKVFVMVVVHGLFVDVGLERVVGVGERRQFIWICIIGHVIDLLRYVNFVLVQCYHIQDLRFC